MPGVRKQARFFDIGRGPISGTAAFPDFASVGMKTLGLLLPETCFSAIFHSGRNISAVCEKFTPSCCPPLGCLPSFLLAGRGPPFSTSPHFSGSSVAGRSVDPKLPPSAPVYFRCCNKDNARTVSPAFPFRRERRCVSWSPGLLYRALP